LLLRPASSRISLLRAATLCNTEVTGNFASAQGTEHFKTDLFTLKTNFREKKYILATNILLVKYYNLLP
jgi:hypothetical protein